jgi:hypothetical protein
MESETINRPANATLEQAAKYLQLSTRTITNFQIRGLLKPLYYGRRRFYRWGDLERLAKNGTR